MKLGCISDNTIYGTRGPSVCYWDDGDVEQLGSFPNPDGLSFPVFHSEHTKQLLKYVTGWYASTNVWAVTDQYFLGTAGRYLFQSLDGGRNWRFVRELPPSSGPMGVLPTSVCYREGHLYLCEYTLRENDARILVSEDYGESWRPLVSSPKYRHFHGIFYDPYGDLLWATTGDADEESAIGVLSDGEFVEVGSGGQEWRAVELAFTPSSVIWGMDCSYCDDVRLFRMDRENVHERSPDPEPLHHVASSVYYIETIEIDGTHWVAATTQAEAGGDSTAPPRAENSSGRTARVWVASSESEFARWHEAASFERTRTVSEHAAFLPTANGYLFLESDPDIGFVINPFNMGRDHGSIHVLSPARITNFS